MLIWAIVPVKPLRRGKSRLADMLNEDERTELNSQLLKHTLKTLKETDSVSEVLVISRDPKVWTIAHEYNVRTIYEDGSADLNTALKRAVAVAKTYTTHGVLILPADLPLISSADIEMLIEHAKKHKRVVVITPDRHKEGTNALFISPSNVIEFGYGEKSFERHCQRAREAGAHLEICDLPSLGLDLDLPEDLMLVAEKINFHY